jgi:hypothetical protein
MKTDSNEASVQSVVVPKRLESGHYRWLIERMGKYLVDKRQDLVDFVERKKFNEALRTAIEIRETEFWVEQFEHGMFEDKDYPA